MTTCTCPSGDGSLRHPCPSHSLPDGQVDGCTESECARCHAHPDHRGAMEHAGISDFRQPVGQEPVAWVSPGQLEEFRNGTSSFGSRIPARVEKGGLFDMPLYAAPPAQETAKAADLEQFRSLARWVANCAGHGINASQRRMGEKLLELIDRSMR